MVQIKFVLIHGNIGNEENVKKVVEACRKKHIPIRIGVNSRFIRKRFIRKI